MSVLSSPKVFISALFQFKKLNSLLFCPAFLPLRFLRKFRLNIWRRIEEVITRTTRNRLAGDEPARGFESHRLRHVVADCVSFAATFLMSPLIHSVAPPLPRKGTFAFPVRLQARSQRKSCTTTFSRLHICIHKLKKSGKLTVCWIFYFPASGRN